MVRKKRNIFVENDNETGRSIPVIAEIDNNDIYKMSNEEEEHILPILPLRNMILFPSSILTVSVGRESSLKLVNSIGKSKDIIGVFCQTQADIENPRQEDLFQIGTTARLLRVFEMPDESTTIVLQGIERINLKSIITQKPFLKGSVTLRKDILPDALNEKENNETDSLIRTMREDAKTLFSLVEPTGELNIALNNIDDEVLFTNFLASNIRCDINEKYRLLSEDNFVERMYHLATVVYQELALAKLNHEIQKRTHMELDQQQREYFLQQQIKNIQEELGGGSVQGQDVQELQQKAQNKKWNESTKELFEKEVAKLERINPQTPDYHVQLNYLQTLVSLPWGECSNDNLDLANARKILDRDHYGLEKVKERILEHLAVIKLRGDLKSPIICLYGPPGVGKTSLGKSIAEALKRKYVRMSLGGLHDESEIRGHRRTYIGAMPGRIIKNIAKAGTDNPVFILDEIDKVGGSSNHGDPSSALLEVLDTEQNNTFHDNFLDIDYDLSKVMFIATANDLASIPAPLLDRMELIEISGYLTEEKVEIARQHLVRKEMKANGISDEKITIRKNTIEKIVEDYTRESGVRTLEKKIGKLCRRLAMQKATDGHITTTIVKPENLNDLLGPKIYTRDKYQGNDYAGVVVGLAWTAVGGEILFIETSLSKGKGENITLTGNLGDVMKESAILALEYIKSHAEYLKIPYEVFEHWNVHLHVPEGAIPKDGPSAGITMATALASAFTQRKVKANLAMTGEITLRGKVLPVGGIKEKILAAKRAGIKEIILCRENKRDIDTISQKYIDGLTFHYVDDIKEVFEIALLDEKIKNPLNLS
ncbi:MAG: endopeptidase La [Bacteroidales bacterium]|nr:endopeptidase La [Bacteroidales bacterium]